MSSPSNLFPLICSQRLVYLHQFRHVSRFGVQPAPEAVSLHHGLVVVLVSLTQLRWHGGFIVEACEAGIRVEGAGIENRLGGLLDHGLLLASWSGPEEVVIDYALYNYYCYKWSGIGGMIPSIPPYLYSAGNS